jgi:hypothetical protein
VGEDSMVSEQELSTAWWHVGRFFYGFALLETSVNEAFEVLFNMSYNTTLYLLFASRLGLNERLELIQLGLRRKGVDKIAGLIDVVRELLEFRNIVAHSAFGPDERMSLNHDERIGGAYFDYLNKSGKVVFSNRVRELVGGEPEDSFISYAAFCDLDRRMTHIAEQFRQLAGSCAALSDEDFDDETLMRMREALDRNVTPFKRKEDG